MNDSLVLGTNKSFVRANTTYMYDTNLSLEARGFFALLVNYAKHEKYSKNWTKKQCMNVFHLTRYKVDKIYDELTENGYIYCAGKVYPHKDSNRISYEYTLYEDPKMNGITNLTKVVGDKDMISSTDSKEIIKAQFENQKPIIKNVEKQTTEKLEAEVKYYNMAVEKLKSSRFADIINPHIKLDLPEELATYLKSIVTKDFLNGSISDIADVCWNTIVKSITYNKKAFNSYRYSESGNKMAITNIKAIIQAFNKFDIYQENSTKLNGIKESMKQNGLKLNRVFLVYSSAIISNYTKLGFLDGKLPDYKELMGLLKTLADHPELIYLENNVDQYLLLDKFFKENQKLYSSE